MLTARECIVGARASRLLFICVFRPCNSSLELLQNGLTGTVPSSISALRQLQYLELSVNKLSGEIMPGLSTLTMLRSVEHKRLLVSGTIRGDGVRTALVLSGVSTSSTTIYKGTWTTLPP